MPAHKWNSLKHKSSPEVRASIRREALDELERLGYGKLTKARRQTQVEVARELGVPQSAISRMEAQSDLLLSTLRKYIQALGGELQVRAVFPDGQFELATAPDFSLLESKVPSSAAPEKRLAAS